MQPWAKKTSRTPRNMDSYKILDFFWHVTHLFTLLMFFCRCFLLRNSAAFVFTDWYIERPGLNLERNFCNSNKWQVLFQSWDYIMLKKGRNGKKREKIELKMSTRRGDAEKKFWVLYIPWLNIKKIQIICKYSTGILHLLFKHQHSIW